MIPLFAITTRGLEQVSAAEMANLPGWQVDQVGYRRIAARYSGPLEQALALRTVDDLFIHLAEWHGISHQRAALATLHQLSLDLDLWPAAGIRSQVAPLSAHPTFSVSANFVGRRNYTVDEIKGAVAAGVEAISGWRYQAGDQESEINIRLFMEHEHVFVGMRLGERPLSRRAYKVAHVPGSLKPPVAAALLRLAGVRAGERVLDPFCGAGTILIEAALLGAHAQGGDLAQAALAAATANAQAAGVEIDVQRWDARRLPLEAAAVDRVVTNLPWGRQIEIEADQAQFYQEVCLEMQRVLDRRGSLALLTTLPQLVELPAMRLADRLEISLFGQQATILVYGPTDTTATRPGGGGRDDASSGRDSAPPHPC
ncbi:MAG TPA: methyltransferase domain-containing protein [Caldilineaceae bacterium]|nr:methyltransferase domain-containing protein [Caldilineaceae bacterium]